MFIVKCDRCGKEQVVKSLMPMFGDNKPDYVQKYMITATDDFRTISLCEDCENEFTAWLEG